jgi:ubiquinone/menaquinone biosynthesis C-methylase UbiE
MTGDTSTTGDGDHRQREQAAAFDAIGARYDEIFPHKDGQVDTVERLVAHLADGARVLDIGCGTGIPTARQLADAGCAVTGIDISPVMLDLARRNVPAATFLQRDALDIDEAVGRFDAVVAFFSLIMLPRREIIATLDRIRRLLVPGGWLALAMVEADLDDVTLPFLGLPVRLTGWPREQLRAVVEDAGFTIDAEDARSYESPDADVPPETQLFLLGRRHVS